MENLEKSWNFKRVVSRPGEVLKRKEKSPKFWKSPGNLLYSYCMCIHAEFLIINMLLTLLLPLGSI